MKKILMVLLAVVVLSGCGAVVKENEAQYTKITAEEAKEMMDTQDVIILDVRTEAEYEEEYIEGALLIPDYELENMADSKLPDKDAQILVYCRSGSRSEGAAKLLVDMGYMNIYDFGGIIDWPYETTTQE